MKKDNPPLNIENLKKKLSVVEQEPDFLAHFFRLKKPCADCPFIRDNEHISTEQLEAFVKNILEHEFLTRMCIETTDSSAWETIEGKRTYHPTGQEAMCAGAAAFLIKRNNPTLAMSVAFSTNIIPLDYWDEIKPDVID